MCRSGGNHEEGSSPGLKYVALNDCFSLDDFDFSPLSAHERLEGLSFFGMRDCLSSIDEILKHIRRLDGLSIISASPINSRIIRSVASINGLVYFTLWNPVNSVNGVDWSLLGECESLRRIDIQGARLRAIDLTFVGRLRQFASLTLDNNRLREVDLGPLSDCKRLTTLRRSHNGLDEGISLKPLSSCASLETLFLTGTHLTEIDLSPLAGSGLVSPCLTAGRIRAVDLSPMAKWRSLRKVLLGDQHIKTLDLLPLATRSDLRWLQLSSNGLSKIDLSPLESCTELEALDLGGDRLKSIDLSPLSSCSSLRELRLEENRLTSVDLSPLWACPNIKLVDLRGNPLGEVDKSPARTAEVKLTYPSKDLGTVRTIADLRGAMEDDVPDAVDTIITEREDEYE